jgi:hypothetical protein
MEHVLQPNEAVKQWLTREEKNAEQVMKPLQG